MLEIPVTDLEAVAAAVFAATCVLCGALLLRMHRVVSKRAVREDRISLFALRPGGDKEKRVRREYRRIFPRSDVPTIFRVSQKAIVVTFLLLLLSAVLGRI